MTTPTTVSIDKTTLETLLANTCSDTKPVAIAIETAKQALQTQTRTDTTRSTPALPTDTLFEHYGYAVYNTHTQSFVALPDAIHNTSTPQDNENPRMNHAVHVCHNWDVEALHHIAEQYGLQSVEHLRVVTVHLDNARDAESSKHV